MAENTRLIYDIIVYNVVRLSYNLVYLLDILDKLNSNNLEGFLLLIDFEEAFDSVEWNFRDEALKFF